MRPNFEYETSFWEKGLVVAGADEVGRGAFAGPVVASTVVFGHPEANEMSDRIFLNRFYRPDFHRNSRMTGVIINDSKKLNRNQREKADIWIRKNALAFGIGEASVEEINKLGILKAIHKAYRRSIKNINFEINHLLVDAFYVPNLLGLPKGKQTPIIRGDSASFSIAAASIVAKVYRDNLMFEHAKKSSHKKYFWHKNVGYGTHAHRQAILEHGMTDLHRKQFVESFITRAASQARSYA